jgi:hypothetical protein
MAGYTRQSIFTEGDIITDTQHNSEYNQLVGAFNSTTGHKHDGSSGEGSVISLIGDAGQPNPKNKVYIDSNNNLIGFNVNVSGVSVEQVRLIDGIFRPTINNDVDLGSSTYKFKNAYLSGTTTSAAVSTQAFILGGYTVAQILDQDALTANSATALPTQRSVKKYVDNIVNGQLPVAREGVVDLTIVDGEVTIDWEEGTYFKYTNTGVHTINLTNLPPIGEGLGQTILVVIEDAGNYGITLNPALGYSVTRPSANPLNELTVGGTDFLVCSMYSTDKISVVPILDMVPQ